MHFWNSPLCLHAIFNMEWCWLLKPGMFCWNRKELREWSILCKITIGVQSVYKATEAMLRVQLLCVPISSILACPRISARPACTNKIWAQGKRSQIALKSPGCCEKHKHVIVSTFTCACLSTSPSVNVYVWLHICYTIITHRTCI